MMTRIITMFCLFLAGLSAQAVDRLTVNKTPLDIQTLNEKEVSFQIHEWGITHDDWLRYKTLMKGPRGFWTPHVTPLEALGAHARTAQERKRIAEIYVRKQFERTEAEILFQREINDAWKRLYPNRLPLESKNHLANTKHRALLLKPDCKACDLALKTQLGLLRTNKIDVLDIYLKNTLGINAKLRAWAKRHQIPIDLMDSKRLTLNHGDALNIKDVPSLLTRQANGQWVPVH